MARVPFLGHRARSDILALRGPMALRVDDYLTDTAQLAAALPERKYVVNLCGDRYRFAVALAAAMTREQICLLPPAQTPQLLLSLSRRYAGLYAVCDGPVDVPLECVRYPQTSSSDVAPREIAFPATQIAA